MRWVFSIISISVLSVLFFTHPVFCADNADTANAGVAGREKIVSEAMCLLGEKVDKYPFYVYKDYQSPENRFFPTGYMGDFGDMQIQLNDTEHKYSGTSCVQVIYKAGPHNKAGWTGFFWQYPANNWGDMPGGYDLSKAKRLTFWARGEKGGEVINTFQVGGIHGKYPDAGFVPMGQITLSREWKQYTINLVNIDNPIILDQENKECWPFLLPLSRIVAGFGWATSLEVNGNQGIIFYLDEIRFEND
jgi:hypothetical protein